MGQPIKTRHFFMFDFPNQSAADGSKEWLLHPGTRQPDMLDEEVQYGNILAAPFRCILLCAPNIL